MTDASSLTSSSFFASGVTKRERTDTHKGNNGSNSGKSNDSDIKGMIPYPCCPKEAVMVFEDAHGKASIKCPKCGKYARFDYDRMTATIAHAYRGASQIYKTK